MSGGGGTCNRLPTSNVTSDLGNSARPILLSSDDDEGCAPNNHLFMRPTSRNEGGDRLP